MRCCAWPRAWPRPQNAPTPPRAVFRSGWTHLTRCRTASPGFNRAHEPIPRLRRRHHRPAEERGRHPARQPQPAHAGRLWRPEFATPNLDRLARALGALHPPLHRLAALHAGAPRHPVRRAGFPLAALGLGGDLGGRHHLPAARRRRDHPADHRPPAPVRDRRRELPRRLHRLGLSARPRGRPLEDPARSQLGRRAQVLRPREMPYDNSARLVPRRGRLPGPRTMGGGPAGWRRTPASTTASSCSSTSSTRTSRSTRPSPMPASTIPTGKART